MPAAFDAKSTADTVSGTNTTSFNQANLTIGGAATGLTYLAVFDANIASPVFHWDSAGTNQLMSNNTFFNAGSGTAVGIFTLLNPTTGAKNLSASWTNSSQVTLYGVSWTGVTGFGTFAHATGTASPNSVTPTAGANDQLIAVHCNDGTTYSATNGTKLFLENSTPSNYDAAGNRIAGPTTALTATAAGETAWVSGGIAIQGAGAAVAAATSIVFDGSIGGRTIFRPQRQGYFHYRDWMRRNPWSILLRPIPILR